MEIDSRQLSAFSCQLLNKRGQHAFHLCYLLEEMLADEFIEVTQVAWKDKIIWYSSSLAEPSAILKN